ncbi:hypothetical protein MMC29_008426, partial [Sticta canariensis]|nr:hypothetical protein [Sticta canariensis]
LIMPYERRYRKPDKQRKKQSPKTVRKESTAVQRMQIVTKHRDGKTFQVIANETNIPLATVAKIYRTAMNKSMNLQIHVDNPEVYSNNRI